MSSLDVRIGSSPSSGFLKLHPWESDLGGLGGNSFVSFLIDVRFSGLVGVHRNGWIFSVKCVSKEMSCGLHGRVSLGIVVDWAHKRVHLMRGGAWGALLVIWGVGYTGCSQRRMRRVNR